MTDLPLSGLDPVTDPISTDDVDLVSFHRSISRRAEAAIRELFCCRKNPNRDGQTELDTPRWLGCISRSLRDCANDLKTC